ncbi:hypothetical protein J2S16_002054 [Cytobacillus kochii]|nr:hypothetical protein [Cytobacillus kochii]
MGFAVTTIAEIPRIAEQKGFVRTLRVESL